MPHNYSESEIKIVKENEAKAIAALKENFVSPSAQIQWINLGSIDPKFADIFGLKVLPYLADTLYSSIDNSGVPSTDPSVNPQIK